MGFLSSIGKGIKKGVSGVKSVAKSVASAAKKVDKVVDVIDKVTDNDVFEYATNIGGSFVGLPNAGTMARKSVNTVQSVTDRISDTKGLVNKFTKSEFSIPGLNSVTKLVNKAEEYIDNPQIVNQIAHNAMLIASEINNLKRVLPKTSSNFRTLFSHYID